MEGGEFEIFISNVTRWIFFMHSFRFSDLKRCGCLRLSSLATPLCFYLFLLYVPYHFNVLTLEYLKINFHILYYSLILKHSTLPLHDKVCCEAWMFAHIYYLQHACAKSQKLLLITHFSPEKHGSGKLRNLECATKMAKLKRCCWVWLFIYHQIFSDKKARNFCLRWQIYS